MSYLIDDLDKISHTLVMINGKWYIAKPIGGMTIGLKDRIINAI